MKNRQVVANDNTGKWEVWQGGAILASFDSESLAVELASAPNLFETMLRIRDDIKGFIAGDWEGSEGWEALISTANRAIDHATAHHTE